MAILCVILLVGMNSETLKAYCNRMGIGSVGGKIVLNPTVSVRKLLGAQYICTPPFSPLHSPSAILKQFQKKDIPCGEGTVFCIHLSQKKNQKNLGGTNTVVNNFLTNDSNEELSVSLINLRNMIKSMGSDLASVPDPREALVGVNFNPELSEKSIESSEVPGEKTKKSMVVADVEAETAKNIAKNKGEIGDNERQDGRRKQATNSNKGASAKHDALKNLLKGGQSPGDENASNKEILHNKKNSETLNEFGAKLNLTSALPREAHVSSKENS